MCFCLKKKPWRSSFIGLYTWKSTAMNMKNEQYRKAFECEKLLTFSEDFKNWKKGVFLVSDLSMH